MKLTHVSHLLTVALLAGCSGSSAVPSATAPSQSAGTTQVAFVVVVPPAPAFGSAARRQRYIGPSAQSMVASLNGQTLLTANLAASSRACTTDGKSRRCMAKASAPSGNQTFAIATYDGPHGTGNLLAQGSVHADLIPNSLQRLNVTLSGKPAQIVLDIADAYPPAGRPATTAVTVSVLDADGNTIVGDYSGAVALHDGDASGVTRLSATDVSGSSSHVELAYRGGTLGVATISATAPGVATATAVFEPSPVTTEQYVAPQQTTPNGPFPTGVSDICVGPDGNVWATGASTGSILKITPEGNYTFYPAHGGDLVGSEPLGISVGSDKNMWFAEMQGGKIGRITTSGTIVSFTIPASKGGQAQPSWTTLGPDGRTWFVVEGIFEPSAVGAITVAGKMSLWPLPSNAIPQEIVAGPDGNLWITDGGLNAIVVVNTAGKIVATHALTTPNAGPWGITVGPDKNLWFSEYGANLIGRMTTSGSIKEFATPTAFAGPLNLASGPDGNVWFTESGGGFWDFAGKIGYVTPDGSTIRDFPGGSIHEHVHDLAFDSKGHLWYSKFAFAFSALDELVY